MTLKLVTPPDGEVVTLQEAKLYLRQDSTASDALIDELISAAREFTEGPKGRLNRLWLTQTWLLQLDEFPSSGEIMIPLAPVQSVTSVRYYDEDGNLQTVDPLNYYLDASNEPPWVLAVADVDWPATLKAANAVEVTFVGGYAPGSASESEANQIAENVPKQVKIGLKMLVQHWFDNRGLMSQGTFDELPMGIKRILQPFRMFV